MTEKKDDVEADVKKSQESYRQLQRQTRDPESKKTEFPYRLRLGKTYLEEILAPLTGSELKVYLDYRSHANWVTGEAVRGVRKIATLHKLDKGTVLKARESLVKKGYLEKTRKAVRCSYYKVLKI